MSETRRYTADELHGDLYYALPDGAEFVAASDYDDLLAELARVKAESLRVVLDGEAGEIGELEPSLLIWDDKMWLWDNINGWYSPDGHDSELPYYADTIVQPVRLEQWNTTP